MTRLSRVVVALATMTAVLSTAAAEADDPSAPAAAAPTTADLPREIPNGIEMTLADGDTFRIWTSDNLTTVRSKRRDAVTGVWGEPMVVFRDPGLECGDVDARTAAGAVAVIAECDPGWSEDQAPTHSQALYSHDTVTWSSYDLEGEAYDEPGISPNGANAVWPERGGYVTYSPAGFARQRLDTEGQEYTTTATITDAEQVSYLYGAQVNNVCRLVIQSRTGDAPPTRQELQLVNGCQDANFANVDVNTTWFGELYSPGARSTISRADVNAPWAVTELAPIHAPGLLEADGNLATRVFNATDGPLVAVGSVRRHTVRAQAYDPTSQTWGPTSVVYDAGKRKCGWGDNWIEGTLGVLAVDIKCAGRHVVLTTQDAVTWQALGMGRNAMGLSPDGRYVAVPGRSQTHIISAERGVMTVPGGVTGQCDVVVPDGPDGAVLLTAAGRRRGWPTILKESGPNGWQILSKTKLPTFSSACVDASTTFYELPYRFQVHSRWKGYTVQVVQRGGVWTVRRSRF